ncbi:MAG TPA: hypothetical protein PK857_00395 [Hyphomicrobium sp.]|nr:hypothetical protein [Hyphomicrobium sp.]HRO48801.1 hypothetical protein [Hyphomicrobium sp.]
MADLLKSYQRTISELAFEVGWLKQSMKEAADRIRTQNPKVADYLTEAREESEARSKSKDRCIPRPIAPTDGGGS